MTHRTYRTYRKPARPAARRTRSTIFAASVFVGAAIIGVAASPLDSLHGDPEPTAIGIASDEPTAEVRGQPDDPEPTVIAVDDDQPSLDTPEQHGDLGPPMEAPGQSDVRDRGDRRASTTLLGEADGVVPDGVMVTVFDDDVPAVANLDPDLLDALRQAADDAANDGVEFAVNSGWRSPAYQQQLLAEAIVQYGSEAEAARWVATADTSAHVSGDAVDIGPTEASTWLSENGAGYGLCQIYGNEPWHFELRPDAIEDGCPAMYPDPTHDPRMQR